MYSLRGQLSLLTGNNIPGKSEQMFGCGRGFVASGKTVGHDGKVNGGSTVVEVTEKIANKGCLCCLNN